MPIQLITIDSRLHISSIRKKSAKQLSFAFLKCSKEEYLQILPMACWWVCQMCLERRRRKRISAMWHPGPKFRRRRVLFALHVVEYVVRGYGMNSNGKCIVCFLLSCVNVNERKAFDLQAKTCTNGLQDRLTFLDHDLRSQANVDFELPDTNSSGTWNVFSVPVQRQHDFLVNWFKWAGHLDDILSTAPGNHSRSAYLQLNVPLQTIGMQSKFFPIENSFLEISK